MKTKILYVTDTLIAGGVERLLTEIATRLDKTRFDVQIVCLYGDKAGLDTHFLPVLEAGDISVTVLNRGWSTGDKLKLMVDIVRIARQYQPDIIHMLNYHSNFLARFVRPILPRSTILIGTVWTVYTPKQLRYQQLTHRLCNHFVVNSPHLEKLLITDAQIPPEKITFIPTAVDLARFQHVTPNEHTPVCDAQIRRLMLFPGRITPGKGQHLLAEAIGRLYEKNIWQDDTVVWMIGGMHKSGEQEKLTASIERYGLQDVIKQLPRTEHMERYYQVADICLLPSLSEGMSNVAIESLAAGKPLLTTDGANQAGVIDHEHNGWVVPAGDIEALADILQQILKLSDDDLETMRDNCLEAAQKYSIETMLEAYTTLYQRFVV